MRDFKVEINWKNQRLNFNDSVIEEYADYQIFIDGIILNERALRNKFAHNSLSNILYHQIEKGNLSIFNELNGEFNGFIFLKKSKEFYFFNNHHGSRKMFYSLQKEGIVVSNRLATIVDSEIVKMGTKSLDVESAYQLLTVSNLLENNTLIKEVKKLQASELLQVKVVESYCHLSKYSDYTQIEVQEKSNKQYIDEFHERFSFAVKESLDWDAKHNKPSIAFLSGGLDSRMTVLTALQENRKLNETLCFSNENYLDHRISEKIADDFQIPYTFVPLNSIDFIKPIDELCSLNEYSIYFTGSSHVHYALQQIETTPYENIQSGQIGDGILGNFNSSAKLLAPKPERLLKRKRWGSKAMDSLQKCADKYPSEETFLLYEIGFNRTVAGSYVTEQYMHLLSPFFHPEVIRYALSIPPKLKYNHQFYFQWMKEKVPAANQYIWESTGLKPQGKWSKPLGIYGKKRLYKYGNRLLGKGDRYMMIPYAYHFDAQPEFSELFQKHFDEKIDSLSPWPELQMDVEIQFRNGDFFEKVLVLTLLSGIKNLF